MEVLSSVSWTDSTSTPDSPHILVDMEPTGRVPGISTAGKPVGVEFQGPVLWVLPHTFQYTAMVKSLGHKALEVVTITFQSYHELPSLQ